ncbi:MAG: hypothetical protein JSV17_02350 [Candidatus Aminicenantes bacterium]|nr:MAG: hypothetical protein JSV17_02350 [Candidatus Aminicenantes bacterium]
MKNFRSLRLLGLVALLAFTFVFVGIDFVDGQVKTLGKPDKPPGKDKGEKYAWSAVILPASGGYLSSIAGFGDPVSIPELNDQLGWLFNDSDENVNVYAEIRGPVQDQYGAVFIFEILNPVPDQKKITFDYVYGPTADFRDNLPTGWEAKVCRYPGCIDPICRSNAMCVFNFLQSYPHPYETYDKMWFHIHSKWSYDRNKVDFEQWATRQDLGFWLDFQIRPGVGIKCNPADLAEHNNVLFDDETREYGYFEKIDSGDENIDMWRAVAGMNINDVPFIDDPNKNVSIGERYYDCSEVQVNNKKTKLELVQIHSIDGSCDLIFEIVFIRTKL